MTPRDLAIAAWATYLGAVSARKAFVASAPVFDKAGKQVRAMTGACLELHRELEHELRHVYASATRRVAPAFNYQDPRDFVPSAVTRVLKKAGLLESITDRHMRASLETRRRFDEAVDKAKAAFVTLAQHVAPVQAGDWRGVYMNKDNLAVLDVADWCDALGLTYTISTAMAETALGREVDLSKRRFVLSAPLSPFDAAVVLARPLPDAVRKANRARRVAQWAQAPGP